MIMRKPSSVIRGNALALPLADSSVDLIVTSPPYFGLRSYQDGGEHYDGQIGSEATPAEFVDALLAATREMVRVLKPSGSIWVNLGDKYATADHPGNGTGEMKRKTVATVSAQFDRKRDGKSYGAIKQKSLIGIPWRYALRCIDDLGLILRAEIIWSKPNGLPESVTDRVRRSHEQWFHFVTQPRYFSAVDEIREEHIHPANGATFGGKKAIGGGIGATADRTYGHNTYDTLNPLGKLPGSVWTVPTQPLKVPPHLGVDHFAAFPMEWPRRIIQGWSPAGICTGCGEGRRPVTATTHERPDGWPPGMGASTRVARRAPGSARPSFEGTITGYACACPEPSAPTRPSTILDPFGGTGTVALVAKALGRHGISIDLSQDYCRLAEWRTTDPGQLADALQIEKPDVIPDDQLSLLDYAAGVSP